MKKELLLILFLFASETNIFAQKDTLYIYEVAPTDPAKKEIIAFRKLHAKIYMAANSGVITAYSDRMLTKKISAKDVKSQGTVRKKIQVALDPDNPEKLTDTFEIKTVDIESIDEYFVVGVWNNGQEPKITAIAPAYKEDILDPNFKAQFWLKYDEVLRLFNGPETAALKEKFMSPPKY